MKTFEGRVAVITGAGSGFGREFALKAAKLKMKVVLADVQENSLYFIREDLEDQGVEVLAVQCDVSKKEQVQALADAAMARFGAVHLVFNNAGVCSSGLIWEHSHEDWEWVVGVNMWGVIHGVRIFTNLMFECAKIDPTFEGHIVNTASMAGFLTTPLSSVYDTTKHAIVALTECLYQDLRLVDAPINCSVICPYFVPTGISQSVRNRPANLPQGELTASQKAAQFMIERAIVSSKVSARDIANLTFDAIANDQFYIYSHPGALGLVKDRMDDILKQQNPGDPYKTAPHIRTMLVNKMAEKANK